MFTPVGVHYSQRSSVHLQRFALRHAHFATHYVRCGLNSMRCLLWAVHRRCSTPRRVLQQIQSSKTIKSVKSSSSVCGIYSITCAARGISIYALWRSVLRTQDLGVVYSSAPVTLIAPSIFPFCEPLWAASLCNTVIGFLWALVDPGARHRIPFFLPSCP